MTDDFFNAEFQNYHQKFRAFCPDRKGSSGTQSYQVEAHSAPAPAQKQIPQNSTVLGYRDLIE